jgi:hypothetical protein
LVILPIVLAIAALLPASAAAWPLDGWDPVLTGCNLNLGTINDQVNHVYDAAAGWDYGDFYPYPPIGYVELKWSTACLTNWGEVRYASGPTQVELYRPWDGAWTSDNFEGGTGTGVDYTPMLYGQGMTVCVNGGVNYDGYFTYNRFCA